jgi:2-dehydro-3-deoxyphosphogluconate aldolase/(4S)-4-hydroxy-2-oxoglutarate aldolase
LALLPGVATGSEIMMAQEDGFTDLKFFPAMQAGGPPCAKPGVARFLMFGFARQAAWVCTMRPNF